MVRLALLLMLSPVLALAAQNTTGASFVTNPNKPQTTPAQNQTQNPYEITNCGQRCAYLTAAEVLSYYSLYVINNQAIQNTPQEQQKAKTAIQNCLGGNTAKCSKDQRELLLARATQYNYYRNMRRQILELQSNADALNSAPLVKKGKKNFDPRVATKTDLNLIKRLTGKMPAEEIADQRKPFKIDPNSLVRATSDQAAFGGGFRKEYDFILNNYARPTNVGARPQFATAYADPAAAGYANYKPADSGLQVHDTQVQNKNRVVTVDRMRHAKEAMEQNAPMLNRARQEFEQQHRNRDPVVQKTPQGVVMNYQHTGIDKLGLRATPNKTTDQEYKSQVLAMNKVIDDVTQKKQASSKDKQVIANYNYDISDFDKFLDTLWPTK